MTRTQLAPWGPPLAHCVSKSISSSSLALALYSQRWLKVYVTDWNNDNSRETTGDFHPLENKCNTQDGKHTLQFSCIPTFSLPSYDIFTCQPMTRLLCIGETILANGNSSLWCVTDWCLLRIYSGEWCNHLHTMYVHILFQYVSIIMWHGRWILLAWQTTYCAIPCLPLRIASLACVLANVCSLQIYNSKHNLRVMFKFKGIPRDIPVCLRYAAWSVSTYPSSTSL